MKHLSVSVDKKDRATSIPAMRILMEEFGMERSLGESFVNMEEDVNIPGHGIVNAINVIQPI